MMREQTGLRSSLLLLSQTCSHLQRIFEQSVCGEQVFSAQPNCVLCSFAIHLWRHISKGLMSTSRTI